MEVSKKRHWVSMALKASNQAQITKVTMMAILCSLDIMRHIQDLNFSNHSTVAIELVKFLAVNTEFQLVNDLQSEVGNFKEDIATL